MHRLPRGLAAALLAFLIVAAAPAQDSPKYHNDAEMSAQLRNLAAAHKGLVTLESIGKTREKRDLWLITIANPAGVPLSDRPALLVAGGFEADHLFGSELALAAADYLLRQYPANAAAKKALDESVIYVLPRANPDGAEAFLAPVKAVRRTNSTPIDDDNDARIDEDGPADLNKDGLITLVRVKDPQGAYMIDPEDKRLMKKADPKKGEKGEYSLYWEGRDQDGDGFIGEDGPGGVNINRNFMHEYPAYKPESGPFMVSEAETRALLAWMIEHRNIAAILTFGESDNLIVPPNTSSSLGTPRTLALQGFAEASTAGAQKTGMFAGGLARLFGGRGGFPGGEMMIPDEILMEIMSGGGGFFMMGGPGGGGTPRSGQAQTADQPGGRMRMPQRQAALTVNAADVDYFRTIGARYAELTGIKTAPITVKPEGAFFQYGYFQFGVPSFCTPGWGLPESPRGPGGMPGSMGPAGGAPGAGAPPGGGAAAMSREQIQAMMAQRGGAIRMGAPAAGDAGAEGTAVDKALLLWMDKEKIDGFVPWTKFKHPDFGEVEVGGFKPGAGINPPPAKIAEMTKGHAEFALYLTSLFSKVRIAKFEAEAQGGGLYRIKAEVENSGFLPTALAHAVTARAVKSILVQLQAKPEAILSGNTKSNLVQVLNGLGGRASFDWLVKGRPGETIGLKVKSQKSGTDFRSIVLK